jgi:hypothetical protein
MVHETGLDGSRYVLCVTQDGLRAGPVRSATTQNVCWRRGTLDLTSRGGGISSARTVPGGAPRSACHPPRASLVDVESLRD